ncbi:MAG: NAD(P)-dependent oxidoreductase [Polyangiaceae bacterium]
MSKLKITQLGLGAMGRRMARRLLDAGHAVTVYNRTRAATEPLVAAGARGTEEPREAVDGAHVVVACVRDDEAARSVWLDEARGAARGLGRDTIVIESSTLTPACARELGAAIGAERFLEAPVVGSRPQAEAGQLVHLVGGQAATVERAREVLSALGARVHHVGAIGQAATMKLVVNSLFGIQIAALAETLGLAERSGIAVASALEVLGALPITSPAMAAIGSAITREAWAPLFPIELVAKDFGYALAAAEAVGAKVPTVDAVAAVYEAAAAEGLAQENIHAVAKRYLG